ncbi:hypothetical protein GcC1_174038 [Golovinomyces cichoracearum]|uniref:Uncharacterized protein n=1 Tax=Golovinomyces cichoracearum TaxID=62708 RepID=A0A420HQC2_9PEZI|nr:hypothetical protein GcC1_174038 [Golovinomyces cichoracearum]
MTALTLLRQGSQIYRRHSIHNRELNEEDTPCHSLNRSWLQLSITIHNLAWPKNGNKNHNSVT